VFGSPLFRRFFYLILSTVAAFAVLVSLFSVPRLRRMVYENEERAAQTITNDVFELLRANYLSNRAYEESVLAAHKRELKNVTLFVETYLKSAWKEVRSGRRDETEGKRLALEALRSYRYGRDNYVWVSDFSGRYLSHPDPAVDGKDFSEVRDVFGNYVLTPLIEMAREQGEGYHEFWWQRLGDDLPVRKLAYARLFPEWEWVIGTGVYLDDLEAEIALRKENMIADLREILSRIASQHKGEIYVFDSFENIIIHPDRSLENTTVPERINLVTGNRLVDDLKRISRSTPNHLEVRWRPGEGREPREAIAWGKYVEGFDWFVVFSIDREQLNRGWRGLQKRIVLTAVLVALLSVLVIAMLVGRLIRPIHRLSLTAAKVEAGDLSARIEMEARDEIGFLASAFNRMVARLRASIEELDRKVLERTRELDEKNERLQKEVAHRRQVQEELALANRTLSESVERLEAHNRQIRLLNRMDEMLQACHVLEETFPVVRETLSELFPDASGVLYVVRQPGGKTGGGLRRAAAWGRGADGSEPELPADRCWALRLRKMHVAESPGGGHRCDHVRAAGPHVSFCLPLMARNEVVGLLHLLFSPQDGRAGIPDDARQLATAVADHLSMAQANILLRERLHRLSVRDGLTGLFNRRYMEETLAREFRKARRGRGSVGVIMLDVDHFKRFNDTRGHEAGDRILVELGRLLENSVRAEDVVCRYGGEEFVVILPGISPVQAVERAERIRERVERDLRVEYEGAVLRVTVSLGVALFPLHGEEPVGVLNAADEALYRAKQEGRNRTVAALTASAG